MPIPPAVEPTWNQIWNDVVNAHAEWKIHEQLFDKGPERIKLLDRCASNFFALFQDGVLLSIQLRLTKLGDPAQGFKQQDNLTFAKLRDEIKQHDPETDVNKVDAFQTKLEDALQNYKTQTATIRERRNKWLAHPDYDTALNRRPVPILTPTRMEIQAALDAAKDFMRLVEGHFDLSSTSYDNVNTINDGETIVHWLKRAQRHMELENSSVIPYGDAQNSPWVKA